MSVAERLRGRALARQRRRRAPPRARARGDPARRARLGLRLHAVPAAPRHRLAQRRLRRRGRLRPVPLDLRLLRPLRALHGPGLRLRRRAREGGRPRACCGCRRRSCCPSSSRRSPRPSRRTSRSSRRSWVACAARPSATTGDRARGVRGRGTSRRDARHAGAQGPRAVPELRPAPERRRAPAAGGAGLRARARGPGARRAGRRPQRCQRDPARGRARVHAPRGPRRAAPGSATTSTPPASTRATA